MKKIVVLVLVWGILAFAWVYPLAAQGNDAQPAIVSFTTSMTQVDRGALANRTARVPVSWQAINRPVTANLIFDQVLPDGSAINVELPRVIPWVASTGYGVAAPILPDQPADDIKLRVRLVNLITGHVYDEAFVTVSIGTGSGDSGDPGSRPAITLFTTSRSTVRIEELQTHTARIPVTWQTINRPITANLVFEQVLTDGSFLNVELPRDIQWVASSGQGVMAPGVPGGGSTLLNLRVRLVDLVDGRVYDQRSLTVSVDESPPPAASIRYYYTTAPNVSASALAARSAHVPVFWWVDNRPASTNLVFEQILPDGTLLNVELPRDNPWVASSGEGIAAPMLPSPEATTIRLQVRLVDLPTDTTVDTRDFTLPIVGRVPFGTPEILTFSTTPAQTSPGGLVYLAWEVRNAVRVGIREVQPSGQFGPWHENLPAVGQLAVFAPGPAYDRITYLLEAIGSGGERVTQQITVPLVGAAATPVIAPTPTAIFGGAIGGSFTLITLEDVGDIPQGARVRISHAWYDGSAWVYVVVAEDELTTAEARADQLGAAGAGCPFATTLVPDNCPQQQTSLAAAYQAFEGGQMVWAGGTIYVLYPGGAWDQYADTWQEGETLDGDEPPAGRFQPVRGFGKLWTTQPQVRDRLGWALSQEQGYTAIRETHALGASPTTHLSLPDGRTLHLEAQWRIQ